MKKNLYIILSLCLSLSFFAIPVSANEEKVEKEENSVVECFKIREFEMIISEISEYEKRPEKTLMSVTQNSEYLELSKIKKDYIDFLYQQKELSIEELKRQNYDNEQIAALKSFDGSERMAIQASAYVYVSGGTMANTTTRQGVRFAWHWMGTPGIAGPAIYDGVAVSWVSNTSTASFLHTEPASGTQAWVDYGNTSKSISLTLYDGAQAVTGTFAMSAVDTSTSRFETAMNGVIDVYITLPPKSDVVISHTAFDFVYAHRELVGTVSFGFPATGSVSINDGYQMCFKSWGVTI